MTDPKTLKKLIKFLRSQGITEYRDGDLEIKLSPVEPEKPRKSKSKQVDVSDQVNLDPGMPTKEELLFWSARQTIEDDTSA